MRAGLVLLLALAACSRAKPSPEFEQAQQLHTRLYADQLDDAYLDPQMARVEELLLKVPPKSLDAPAAAELLDRVRKNRARMEQERAEREKAAQAALEPTIVPFSPGSPAAAAEADAGAEEDAGVPQPTFGMSMADFARRFSDCFRAGATVLVVNLGPRETWELKDIANCRDRYPTYVGQVLIADGGKLWGMAPQSALEQKLADGGAFPSNPPAPSPANPPPGQ